MDISIISLVVTAVLSLILGLLGYIKKRGNTSNLFWFLSCGAIALWCFGQALGAIYDDRGLVLFFTRLNLFGAVLIPLFYLLFVLYFTGEIKKYKIAGILSAILAGIFLVLDLTPLFVKDVNPIFGYKYYPVPGPVYYLLPFYVIFSFLWGLFLLYKKAKASEGNYKNQLWYIFWASVFGFTGGATAFFPVFGIKIFVLSHFLLPLYIVITFYAILKHKLLDIDILAREGLVYSILTFMFACFYAFFIIFSNYLFKNLTRWDEYKVAVAVVFFSAIFFNPIKNKIQEVIDKIFFKGSYLYKKLIQDLSNENIKLYEKLLQADKMSSLGNLSAGMAHEIKNPLSSIKGMTQILKENINDSDFIDKYMAIVLRQIDRINSIVENLLKLGKPTKKTFETVNLKELFLSILALIENECRKKSIEIKKEMKDVFAQVHPESLNQAFLNVLLNAIDAMPNGGTLSLFLGEKEGRAEVIIEDTGEGILKENLAKIFDPFFTTKEKGTGLGLSVFYKAIKENGGDVSVESGKGEGTRFNIWLYTKHKVS